MLHYPYSSLRIIVLWDTNRCELDIRYGPFIDIKSNTVFLFEKLWLFSNPIEGYLHVIRIREGQVTFVTYEEGYCFQLLSSQQIQKRSDRRKGRTNREISSKDELETQLKLNGYGLKETEERHTLLKEWVWHVDRKITWLSVCLRVGCVCSEYVYVYRNVIIYIDICLTIMKWPF